MSLLWDGRHEASPGRSARARADAPLLRCGRRPLRAALAGLQPAHERRHGLGLAAAARPRDPRPVAGGDRAVARRVALAGRLQRAGVEPRGEIAEVVHSDDPDSQFRRLWRREYVKYTTIPIAIQIQKRSQVSAGRLSMSHSAASTARIGTSGTAGVR